MKIAISLKSNFAFERLDVSFIKYKQLREVERHSKNIQTIEELDDVIEFFKPELLILDTKLPDINRMSAFSKENNVPVVYFEADVDTVIQEVIAFFKLGEKDETENEQKKELEYFNPVQLKTEIVYKDRIVEKEIIKTAYTSIPSRLIVVASMWQGAGATTLSVNLARAIANRGLKVSYVEYPRSKPYLFDYLQVPKTEVETKEVFFDHFNEIKSKGQIRSKGKVWNQKGIDWFVADTRNEPISTFSYEELLKLVYSINSTITIVDVSGHLSDEGVQKFLHHADDIFVCIEPDPVKIDWLSSVNISGKESSNQRIEKKVIDYLNQIEKVEDISYQFVNMRYTKNIDTKTWLSSLEKQPITFVPSINYEEVISAVWNSTFLYDIEPYHEQLEKAFRPLVVRILPREFVKLEKKNDKGSIKNLLKMFKKEE